MKMLIVEDDFTSRMILIRILQAYGETSVAGNGKEAVALFGRALELGTAYDLVCLDIMLPEMDGQSVLREIRSLEAAREKPGKPARVIMTTALNDKDNVVSAIQKCDAYLVKPVDKKRLLAHLQEFGLLPAAN